MEDKKSYYVQIPGTQQGQTWDEDKYNRNADKLREKYPDAVVMETSPYTDGDFADDDLFRVQIPGTAQGQTWDGAKFRRNREALMSKYPDVSISRFSPISGAVKSELNFNDEPQGQPKNVQMPVRGYWDEKGSEQMLAGIAPVKTPQEIAQQQETKVEPEEQQLYPNAGAVSKFDLSRATMPMRQQMDTPWVKSSINQPTSQQEWNDSFEAWKLQQEEGALTAEEKKARLDAIRGKQYDNMPDGERLLAKVKDRRMSDRMRDIIYEGEIASRKEDAEKHALPGFWQGWANARARGLAGLNQLSGELGKAILGDEDYTPKQDALGYLASYIEGTKGEGNAEDLLRNLSKTIKDENGADVSVPFYTIDEKNLKGDEYTKKARKEYERNKNWYEALTEAIKANGGDLEKTFDALNKDVGGKMSRIQQITREAAADIASLPETNGFGAWLGGMMPMVGTTAAGMVASAVTKSPVPAQILGRLSMGLMSADMAGEAMNVARQYGASDAEVFESGLSSAAIMYLMGKIPFNKFTSRVLSVSSNSAAKKMAAAMSDPSTPLGKEAQMLWNNFRKTYGTEKLFSQSNFAQWIADAVSTGSNFATMGALETIVPMIYENPEDYPTFNEILENAKQGFIDGLAFGGATGAASIYARHSANIDRWRKQGGMMYAAMDDGSVAEVLAVNNHPVKFRNPKTYQTPAGEGIQRVVNEGGYAKINTSRGSEAELYTEGALSPHSFGNEATVTILHNGEVKEVPASRLRSIGMKYTEDVIDEYNKVLRDATADEQSGVSPLELEAGVKEAEDAAREQNLLPPGPDGYTSKEMADGTMTDAQIDAAMDYNIAKGMQDNLQQQKRDAIREDILGRTGKPFWNTEHPEGADKDTETVSSIRYDDGREVFLKKGDKDGNYVTLNEDGEAGFITRDQIDALLATGEVTEFNDKLPLDTYLDKRAAEQDAIEEQERLQQEYAQNLTALVEKFQNEKSINIGSPEQEIQAPILAVDGTPEGGVTVQAEEGEKLIPWAEIAAKYDMPYMPQTNEEKVQTLVDANKEEAKAEEAAGEEEPVAPTEEASEPQNIYDDEVANELGIPAEFLKVTKKGRNVVNTNLLWEKNPALLAQYNDKTNVLGMNTVEYLTEKVDQVDKEISKQEALLKKEVLGANDEDRKEDIKDKITELTERRKEIAGVLQPYMDAMKAAEEAAAAEKAALEQEKAEAKAEKAANEDPALREPMTLEEAVANFISGLKKGSLNKEDFMRELGWSDEEAKRFFPYWAGTGKGMTLLKLAEQIGHEDTSGFVPQHGEADQADTQAIRDAVIDVLQSSVSPKDVTDYTKRRNLDRRMEEENYAKGLEEFEAQQAEAATEPALIVEDMPEAVANPVQQEIAAAREEVNTEPTEAQKEAGNYKKGHIQLDGYEISIENPKGSIRKGTDASGKEWQQVMNNDYGYIRMTEGVDGDHIDVFLSDNPTEGNVFVIDQRNPQTGEFDEHKVMYGFNSVDEARAAYLANYEEGWQGLGAITEVTKDEFKKWVDSSHRKTKPFAEYKSVNAISGQNEEAKSSVQGLEKYSEKELTDMVYNHMGNLAIEAGEDGFSVKNIKLIGSRTKGAAKEGSDLDALVEYEGSMREDDAFNALNNEPLVIDGIIVDINPIRKEETGTIKDWEVRQEQWAEEDAAKQKPAMVDNEENYRKAYDIYKNRDKVTPEELQFAVDYFELVKADAQEKYKDLFERRAAGEAIDDRTVDQWREVADKQDKFISALKEAQIPEDMPDFDAQDAVFAFLGTTRAKAVMDRLGEKLTDIDNRLVADAKGGKLTKDSYVALMDEKVAALQEFADAMSTDRNIETVATQLAKLRDVLIEKGVNPYSIQKTLSAVSEAMAHGEYPRGFKLAGKVFLLADNIANEQMGRRTHTHEEEHLVTRANGDAIKLASMPEFSRESALNAIDTMNGFRSETYHRLNDENVADELIAHGVEFGEDMSDADFDKFMQSVGVDNEEITNFVKNRIHERRARKRKLLSEDGRRGRTDALEHVSTQGDLGQDERNLEPRSEGNVGEQGHRAVQSGSSGVGEGGQVAGGESAGRSDSEHPDANHAGAVRRAGEDLKPAERARLEDLDRDGTGKPDIIDNLNDATEGTSLFSLDKKNRSLVGLHNISAEKLRKAIRLGGFANPSCAVIDLNYQNHFEYGDITFLLPSDLVGKRTGRNAGTWVRDAWTPTFPKITFRETKESQKNLKELLKDLPKDLRFLIDRKVYDFINEDTYHSGLEYLFLKEKGMEPEIQVNPRKYPNASEKEFFEKYLKQPEMSQSKTSGSDIMDAYEALSPEDRKMANMYVLRDGDMSKIEYALEMEEKWPHLKEVHEEPLSFAALDSFLYKIMRDERDAGQENIGLTVEKAIETVGSDKALQDEFNAWQDKTIDNLGYEAKMFIGYTDNGRKYKKATLENVSKEMKKEGSNGAQQNSGLSFGSILASMAKKMNSLSEIRANRNRLVSKDEYQQKREELMDKAKDFFLTFYDNNIAKRDGLYTAELVAADYVRDFFIKGHSIDKVVEDFNREQKKSLTLTDEEKAAFNAFRKELQDAPTDMFETKFERPVYINEFAAVVIPDDTPLDVRQALEQIGLKLYEYKGDERSDERAAAVRKAAEENDGVLFSFIGKRGAEAMDIEDKTRERRDNLAVARQMEKDKATPGAIKWATGWERGADGMWRYEIPDFTKLDLFGDVMYDKRNPDHVRYKELLRKTNAAALMPESHEPLTTEEMDEFNNLYSKYNGGVKRDMLEYGMLEDFIDADDLFKAYPQLRRYTLRFEDLPDRVGGYAEKRGVVLNMKNRFQYEKISDDLLHEIQHEIQDIEGFSLGTSLDAAERKARVLNSQSKDALTGREWDFVDLVRLWIIRDVASKAANPLDRWLADWHKDGLYSDELYKEMIEGKSADELKRLYNQLLIKSKKKQVLSSWDVYKRTSGEVEARNASRRRRFTLEERRASAAENTEDVSRADQILNMPASSLLDWTDDEDFSIAMQSQKQPGKTYIKADEDDIALSLAYHGSGADYDRFDISHALEGEGAMAHGYGHYVALNKDVAKGYAYAADGARRGREIRSAVQLQLDKAPSYYAKELLLATVQEMESGVPFEVSKAKTLNMLKKAEEKRKAGRVDDYWKNTSNAKEIEFFEGLNNLDIPQWNHSRNLYTVDIPDDTGENYIHEKKELSKAQRNRIAEALRALPEDAWKHTEDDRKLFGDHTAASLANSLSKRLLNGYEIYAELNHGLGSMKAASKFLSDAGFVGIKYNGGVDGPCAVIFNDEDIKIEEHAMFSLSKNNRSTIEKWLDKREDLSKAQKAAFVGWLDGLSNPTLQLATARWFTQGAIRLPEDMPKVEQAVSVAGKAKVDPLQYDSPMELLDAHADFKPTEKRINPDDVPTLHKAKEFPEHGIVIYDVDEGKESRKNMREIINTHFGKEASPWCLLQGDGNGNLTEQSAQYWKHYNGYPKQVAFKDGKLLAFSANDDKRVRLWWDRQDSPHYDIPAGWRLIKGDALGREVQYVYSENGMLKPEENSFMKKGNRENGEYTEWYPNGNLSEHGFYKNGKKDGLYETYNERQGYLYSRINYKEGVQEGLSEYFHPNGTLRSRTNWKDGKIDGTHELFHDDGSLSYIRHYKGGSYDGLAASYNRDGTPIETLEFKNGREHGKHEMYFSDGKQVKLVENYDDGKLHGAKIKYDYDGYPRSIENYVHGKRQGVQEYYDYGHGKLALRTTEKDNIVRKSEGFNSDGTISFVKRYNEYGEPDGVWKFWTRDGKLDRMLQFENGVEIRDLLAEGVTEQEADVDAPSFSFVSKEEQERLDKEPTVTMYRAMALVDGKLYPPMSSKEPNGPGEKGKRLQMRPASELGRWERADEAPEKAKEGKDGKYYFDLKKSNGESVDGVLYNPYFHTSASPLNDQFTGASQRPELVTVEVEVPISELAGKYKAEKAADAVGAKDWHSGTVTAQMGSGRQVVLSRWVKPVRIVPDAEVAAMVAPKLKEKGISVPANVVTPSLLAELRKQGVSIVGEQNEPMFALENRNQEIFVSNAEKAVRDIKMEKATPEQWLKMIEKNGGLKAGEDKWLGLSDWLKASDKKTLTKQEVLEYIGENKIQIEETQYGENVSLDELRKIYPTWDEAFYLEDNDMGEKEAYIEDLEAAVELYNSENITKPWLHVVDGDLEEGDDGYDTLLDWANKQLVESGHTINSTRLDYTTEGLENKREIALTVPTIEPYNKNDNVHFGDAGEGRAIAWVRFGDTDIDTGGKAAAQNAYGQAEMAYKAYKISLRQKYGNGITDYYDKATDEERAHLNQLKKESERLYKEYAYGSFDKKKALFIDEIQSKRHQDAREKGYKDDSIQEQMESAAKKMSEIRLELHLKYGIPRDQIVWDKIPESIPATEQERTNYRETKKEYERISDLAHKDALGETVPAAPFEKNWHELAMKRMLRLAAEEGYDYVAWTTGDQQAERYNIGTVVDYISRMPDATDGMRRYELDYVGGDFDIIGVDEAGKIIEAQRDLYKDKTLSDLVGKEIAVKMMNLGVDDGLDAEQFRFGAEGMKGFYDDILPRFVNKYVKKWGVKVEDISLPDLEDGLTAHAVPVTEEMKASVMEGQPMFSFTKEGSISDEDGTETTFKHKGGLPTGVVRNSFVERTYKKNGAFTFTGKNKIESAADVAYIFKELEESAIENAFLVFVKEGNPTILHVGMGDISKVNIDLAPLVAGIKDFAPDEVYMVHNHPSGRIEASRADISMLEVIQRMVGKTPVQGVIIDTISGQYGLFDDKVFGETKVAQRPGEQDGITPLEVLTFDKMVFSSEYERTEPISNAEDIAAYLSAHRLGNGSKIGALLLANDNRVVGNLIFNQNVITKDNADILAKDAVDAAVRSAATRIILTGDFDVQPWPLSDFTSKVKMRSGNGISVLDVVKIDGNHTRSLSEGTLMEPEGKKKTLETDITNTEEFKDWFKGSKVVDENGEPRIMYRGDDYLEESKYMGGRWLSFDKKFAEGYGKVGEYFVNARSPFDGEKDAESLRSFIEEHYDEIRGEYDLFFDVDQAYNSVDEIVEAIKERQWEALEQSELIANEIFRRGYDAIYIDEDDARNIMVRSGRQVKSAEPTTYDDNGNEIPQSERFNPEKNDIRFSLVSRQEDIAAAEKEGFKGIMDADERKDLRNAIYNIVPQSIREQIVDEALGNGMNIGKALDDYLQRLAEGGTQNDETGLLRALYNQIRDITGDEALTDEDCRYIIWNEGHGPVADDDIFGLISQRAHKKRFGAGEEAPMFSVRSEFGEATDEAREVAKEKVDEAKAELDETKKEAKQEAKQGALKAITLAMRGQKHYDKKTVDAVVKYAKEILRNGRIASLSRTEVNRLLGLVATSTGKAPAYVKRYVDQLTDTMLDIIVRDEADAFKELMNTKDTKIDSHGVEVMGKVDLLGQEMLKALRDYYNRPIEEIQARLSEISDKLSSKDDAIRKRAWAEKDGLELAEQYQRMIADNKAEEKALKNELADLKESKQSKAISAKDYADYVATTNEAIREGKLDRVDSYRQLSEVLKRLIKKSAEGRADFDDAEAKRVSDIQYDANRDMAGEDSSVFNKESRLGRLVNNRIVRFFARPLATFDQMMRLFARHSITGEGYLYNRYMRGWLRARENYIDAISEAYAQMDAKASEVFGKKMKWTDLYKIDKHLPTMTVRMWDGEKMADIELRQGNLLYIYMANKMLDGKMKLRRMGISEDKVKAIRDNLDPRFVELADWLQGEHLPSLRNKYNAIHEQLFGAPMAAIEDYFPLKIAKGDIPENVDVSKESADSPLSSTVTGHIIKRTKNSRMLDIANANAFDIAVEHLESMEEWAAFARFRKDLNILLSYKHFRNQVKNMNTIYGSGDKLWQNFVDVSKIVAGTYRPEGKGTSLVNLSKGFTSGKINFRLHTALKQTLSYPAFWADARIDDLYHAAASPIDSWNWCMENLPVFKRRWEKRTVGDTRLMKTDSDWKVWQKNFVKAASRYGMVPNAFVDAVTISIGTKAVYDSKLRKYLAEGMSQEEADRRAKQDATIIYNQSQQSDENAFVSALQLDRTFEAAGLSTFRNASMGYQRRVHNAYRTLGRLLSGKKESYIAGMTKQYISEGLSPEQAKARAEQEYSRAGVKAAGELFIYQFFLNFLWKLGPLGALYLIAGGDDDKKKKKLKDAALTTAITGFFEGLSMGGSLTDLTGGWVSGEGVRNWNFLSLPVLQDVQRLWETIENHGIDSKSIFEIVSLLSQGFCGVDPHILSDTFNAVGDAANWDMGLMKEISLLLMRIGQSPQSQMKDFYIDEIKETRKKAGKQSAKELAERYVEYQRKRKDPIGTVIGSDDKETKKKDKAATTKLMNEAFPKKQK